MATAERELGGFYRDLLDHIQDGIYFVDAQRRITYWNRGAERISGFSAEEVTGHCCSENNLGHVDAAGHQLCRSGCALQQTLQDGKCREADMFLKHREGFRVPVRVRVSPMRDANGNIIGAVEQFHDISAALQQEEQLSSLAYTDALTGVGNRRQMEIGLRELELRHRHSRTPWAVIFADVDHFKVVNDRHGHDCGDKALKVTAATLSRTLRNGDLVGRWGGEEFLILLPNATGEQAARVAERARVMVERSQVEWQGANVALTISLGVTAFRAGDTVESLLQRADQLLYRSKAAGRNRVTANEDEALSPISYGTHGVCLPETEARRERDSGSHHSPAGEAERAEQRGDGGDLRAA